jgi:CheY-like chemotaxis protein
VLSDIGMPGEDGYEFIRRLRQLPVGEGGETPAVALTAYGRPEDREKVLSAGYGEHVTKPVTPAALADVVLVQCRGMQNADGPLSDARSSRQGEATEPVNRRL